MSYRETHNVISLLSAFIYNLTKADKENIDMAQSNYQVGDIRFDDDVYKFYLRIFGESYFESE